MKSIIEVSNLTKKYGEVVAIDNISFKVEEGSLFAFLGPNGAGKSTTINIIATLLEKTSGKVVVSDFEVDQNDDEIRKKIGIVFQKSILDGYLTVRENLEVRGSFYGLSKKQLHSRISEIIKLIKMEYYIDRRYSTLSGGEKRKADIARALINSPEILVLDEPTTGLDPKSRKVIWELITNLREKNKMTIFLTTHYMEEVKNASKVIIIDKGKIIDSGTPDELKNKHSYDVLRIIYSDERLLKKLKKDKVEYKLINKVIIIKLKENLDAISVLNKYKDYIKAFEVLMGDMDDVFLNLAGGDLDE